MDSHIQLCQEIERIIISQLQNSYEFSFIFWIILQLWILNN